MQISLPLKNFIFEHINDDTDKLLLSASHYPEIDIPFAVDQILARRQIREKLPQWYGNKNLIFPSRLASEQCSSEYTGCYKQQLLKGKTLCDLTGGLGVDTFFFAQKARQVTYIERYASYCQAAENNFACLQAANIRIVHADTWDILPELHADTFYTDPARRAASDKRAYALKDCEPDILQLKPLLLEKTQRLIIKISPMADIEETLRLLPETREIHILAVKNECKELLFVLEPGPFSAADVRIFAANLGPAFSSQIFSFRLPEEKEADLHTTTTLQQYLYEPHAALLKSGAFKLIANRYKLFKLHRHSHLYTSQELCPDFPGRIFSIAEVMAFSGRLLKQINKQLPQANLTARNFPLPVAELRKRSGIKEGGDIYLFATTLANEQKILIKTHKALS